jgi:pyrroline-5-carboxylate reductase
MERIAILGGGNIGRAIALALLSIGKRKPEDIYITRRNPDLLDDLKSLGFRTGSDNAEAVKKSDIILLTVRPKQLTDLINEIRESVEPSRHILGSVITAYTIGEIEEKFGYPLQIVRIIPNTAIAIGESMTCLAGKSGEQAPTDIIKNIFESLGAILVINEELVSAATIIGACGIAFFLRTIRAASQGGIQVGFHPEDAQTIASQTARGAASLLLSTHHHPEGEIDKVTTPRGCTIAGLNEMEHNGLSSAMIKGIIKSYEEINNLK